MIGIFVYTFSIAFQLAGSLLLLFFSLSTKRETVIRQFAGSKALISDGNNGKVSYNKKAFKTAYRDCYISRIAFIYLVIGYFLSVFDDITTYAIWLKLIMLFVEFLVLFFMGIFIAKLMTRHSKIANTDITSKELDEYGIKTNIEVKGEIIKINSE